MYPAGQWPDFVDAAPTLLKERARHTIILRDIRQDIHPLGNLLRLAAYKLAQDIGFSLCHGRCNVAAVTTLVPTGCKRGNSLAKLVSSLPEPLHLRPWGNLQA
ncbi:hypothetical protein D3C80_1125800 [compost metagenome]